MRARLPAAMLLTAGVGLCLLAGFMGGWWLLLVVPGAACLAGAMP